jgi:hypothetical protein
MSKQVELEAFYDSLSIAHKLDNFLDEFERREVHLFAYFSAFLFHYGGHPVDDWKYKFIIDEEGYPHSKQIDDAIERHINSGAIEIRNIFLAITGRGTDEFNKFRKGLSLFKNREKYIEAACSTAILIPYRETKTALLQDTNLVSAKIMGNEDWINFEYENLKTITQSLGASIDDLTVSAVSWIKFLLTSIENK